MLVLTWKSLSKSFHGNSQLSQGEHAVLVFIKQSKDLLIVG